MLYWAHGSDFGDAPNDKNFNINGILYPDRALKPGIIEAKWSQQPIDVELVSIIAGRSGSGDDVVGSVVVKVSSRFIFNSLCSLR